MQENIEALLSKDESPTLEFKRQWYWDNDTCKDDMSDKWGELLKDLISLSNGYLGHTNKNRYLIFGFDETEKKIYNVNLENIKQLKNITRFKKDLIQRLEKITQPAFINFNLELIPYKGDNLLVFEIPCPVYLTELKKELKTKTRHLDEGAVLIRKGQKSDEIRTAKPSEISEMTNEFLIYRNSEAHKNTSHPLEIVIEKERTIEKTVQLYMDKNTSFSLADKYPIKERNWKDGIIYEVYKLIDGFSGIREFIYIHSSANQSKTLGEIKKRNLVENLSTSIVLVEKPNIKDITKRKNNLKKLFKTEYVFFIDEFGYEYLYKDCILPYEKFNLPIYVNGLYDDVDNFDLPAIKALEDWYDSKNQPLFVVSGHGGIGKTTLAKQFLDIVYDREEHPGILFIDSKEIIHELSRNYSRENKISDVFDFYDALMEVDNSEESRFDKELLKLSIDNGSLLLVLDGIDEVIAKLGDKFDVEKFITSIFDEYSSEQHKTKILITCRDHFWKEVGKSILLPEITLKAFNKTLAEDFFSQKLASDKRKITKAMKMADELAIEDASKSSEESAKTYIPFLLDMIGYLVNTQNLDLEQQGSLESQYLTQNNHTDQLVSQVCKREVIKLESLTVDGQIKFFIRMASSKKNGISIYDIKEEIEKISSSFESSIVDKLKGHPLVQFENEHFYFRYDVFDIYFKSLLIFDLFNNKNINNINEEIYRVINGYLKYDNSFTKSITSKINLDDELIIFCIDLIEKVENSIYAQDGQQDIFISAIVSLLLELLQDGRTTQSNIETRSNIINEIFGSGNIIKRLCLVNIFGESVSKPTFDFRGKHLDRCTFNNYEYFWECNMDDNTTSENSIFKGIDPRQNIKFDIPKNIFTNSDTSHISHLLNEKQEEIKSNKESVISDLMKVFKLFYQRGNFYARKQEEVRKKLSTVTFLHDLISKGVIKNYIDPKKPSMQQYRVNDDYKSVIDYIEQGTPSLELQRLSEEYI
ncbi:MULTISPECIES: NACHT domain-containing protein [Aliivibrio]|uniref:NACHT domain-containing protein n=1 Tax=Aliivibrio finisterrensis TaxID=511998 RepID=A0A4Q5KT98_9GAMM|nr:MULTISPECIES: NACHT domain-containing protein [Aliivibrio]MDD9180233.1 NACHT domain-containing protein [Aliivibrio sp. A6]RYU49279.1 NACHT domain-containing protein [Aliivibrio finisterrensis]RYU49733.1 NACHT domain-containing protein [Aliivibrio finisterrensis]RYU55442.1 NACHT domain-containing protein [Aliivibrio finisterrensis]RYU60783.1 NACHT domain-containing protein [Aliivibrio finisterrensis]